MKTNDAFTLRSICGEHILVPEGLAVVNFNRMFTLNATAAYLWEQLRGQDFSQEDMVNLLLERYDVSPDAAEEDTRKLLQVWQEMGVVSKEIC